MDSLEKQYLQFAITAPRHYSVDGEPWQLWVKDYKLTRNIASNIYALVHDEKEHPTGRLRGKLGRVQPPSLTGKLLE
jgi:hypothetical protein